MQLGSNITLFPDNHVLEERGAANEGTLDPIAQAVGDMVREAMLPSPGIMYAYTNSCGQRPLLRRTLGDATGAAIKSKRACQGSSSSSSSSSSGGGGLYSRRQRPASCSRAGTDAEINTA
jgi:hypothetical protein